MGYMVSEDDGWRMPDWLWERIESLLPSPPFHSLGTHRSRVPERDAMDAIRLVLRTGMQWNALNATGVCSSSSAHRRFQEWEQAGVFAEIWRQGLLEYDKIVGIDWAWLAADGAMSKAPLGGAKTGPNPTGRAKGGEAFGSQRGSGGPDRVGARRRQPPRPEAARADPRKHPDQTTVQLEEAGAGAPDGRISHVALETDGEIQVFDVWESQEAFEAFGATLLPILAAAGVEMNEPMVARVHNEIKG